MKKINTGVLFIIILLIVAGGLVIFQKTNNKSQIANNVNSGAILGAPEDTVKKTATAYWEAVKFQDEGAVYDFFQPDDKKLITKEEYITKQKADPSLSKINEIKIVDVRVEGDNATVRILLTANTGEWPGTDTYKLINGRWYKVMSQENKQFLGIDK